MRGDGRLKALLATGAVALLGLACGSSSLTGEGAGYCPPPGMPGTLTAISAVQNPYHMSLWGPLGSCRMLYTPDESQPPYPLWITDGTPAGTVSVLDDYEEGGVTFQLGDVSLLGSVWRTDGTAAGTFALDPTLHTGGPPTDGLVLAGSLLFDGSDDSTTSTTEHGYQLWRTDGTTQGTFLLYELVPAPGPTSFGPNGFVRAGDLAFFDDGTGNLWRSDGTAAGTLELAPVHKLAWAALGDSLVFVGSDAQSNVGIWRTDGTVGGTSLLQPLGAPTMGGSSFYGPRDFFGLATLGQRVILLASSAPSLDLVDIGVQPRFGPPIDAIWTTDGTPTGTTLVVELPQGTNDQGFSPFVAPSLAPFVAGDLAYFVSSAAGVAPDFSTLWRTDGSATGTVALAPYWSGADVVAGGGRVFFPARTPETGAELWKTDGDPADTRMVLDINPGPADSLGSDGLQRTWAFLGGELIFQANDGVHGVEAWVSDGTESGTSMIADILPGSRSSYPGSPFLMNGEAFFAASPGTGQSTLWRYVP